MVQINISNAGMLSFMLMALLAGNTNFQVSSEDIAGETALACLIHEIAQMRNNSVHKQISSVPQIYMGASKITSFKYSG